MSKRTLNTPTPLQQALQRYNNNDFTGAIRLAEPLLKSRSRDAQLHYFLGACWSRLEEVDRAAALLERAVSLAPNDPRFLRELAYTRSRQGRFEEAHAIYDRALGANPTHDPLISGKAELCLLMGDLEGAARILEPAIERGTQDPDVAQAYAKLRRAQNRPQDAIPHIRRITEAPGTTPFLRAHHLFLLGDLLDRAGRYDEACDAFVSANELRAARFNPDLHRAAVDRVIRAWSGEKCPSFPRASHADAGSALPVFIVGLPRSGTSLVEQIIDAHPDAAGAGEVTEIPARVFECQSRIGIGDPGLLEHPNLLSKEWVNGASMDYLARRRAFAPDARRITDKMPANVMHLGLISLLFPGARVIRCVRDPRDAGISCYFTDFSGALPWAFDLDHIASYARDEARLFAHWKSVLPLPVMEVAYEELVADIERGGRAIIEFLGLPWSGACLEYHRSKRVVQTSSNEQVRRPVYQSSVGRWKHYEAKLGPKLEALAGVRAGG